MDTPREPAEPNWEHARPPPTPSVAKRQKPRGGDPLESAQAVACTPSIGPQAVLRLVPQRDIGHRFAVIRAGPAYTCQRMATKEESADGGPSRAGAESSLLARRSAFNFVGLASASALQFGLVVVLAAGLGKHDAGVFFEAFAALRLLSVLAV